MILRKVRALSAPRLIEASSIAGSIWLRAATPERRAAGTERTTNTITIASAPPAIARPPVSFGSRVMVSGASGVPPKGSAIVTGLL